MKDRHYMTPTITTPHSHKLTFIFPLDFRTMRKSEGRRKRNTHTHTRTPLTIRKPFICTNTYVLLTSSSLLCIIQQYVYQTLRCNCMQSPLMFIMVLSLSLSLYLLLLVLLILALLQIELKQQNKIYMKCFVFLKTSNIQGEKYI